MLDYRALGLGCALLASACSARVPETMAAPPADAVTRTCRLGALVYRVETEASRVIFIAPGGARTSAGIQGADATCIETLSGTMLAVLQRRGREAALAIVTLPSLLQIDSLPLPAGASALAASPTALYVELDAAAGARTIVLRRENLDFREQLIHNVHL